MVYTIEKYKVNLLDKYPFFTNSSIILILSLFFLILPSLSYSQEVNFYIDDFSFVSDGIKISLSMDNTLPEDRPDISGERIKYIDKGTEVKLVYKVKIFKKGWWIFNDTVTVQGKSEIVITRTLKKDIITKIYTVKEYSNVSGIEGLVEESEFNGSILDKDLFKKEKLKKLREAFFEKELTFLINYDLINLSVGGSYYIESKGEYISYVPIFGSGEPRNFYTNTKKSSRITFDGYLTGITSSASRITAPFFDIRYKKFIIDKIKYLLSVLQSN